MNLDSLPSAPSRKAELSRYGKLDAAMEAAFSEIEELAAQICETSVAVITLPEGPKGKDRQETPLATTIYQCVSPQKGLFIVPDLAVDERFQDHALVRGEPSLRFCAGAILESEQGLPMGALCVLDCSPRRLTAAQEKALSVLARQVITKLELLATRQRLHSSEERFLSFMAYSPAACWIATAEGRLQYASPGYYTLFGIKEADVTGRFIKDLFEPELTQLYLENNRTVLRQQSVMESFEPGVRWDGSAGEFLSVRFPITLPGREPMVGGIALD
ncbi:MAG: hypothetical protein JWO08_2448, partial [Verrucomicrobiaceae bacterium]|nr:hypothetical protein [Verrucomicrobiaceae bacterium]